MNDETIMSAEEFFTDEMFGDSPEEKTPVRMDKARGKRSKKNLFAGIKVKMVMRIYGVTKARALEIIAGRAAEKQALEDAKDKKGKRGKNGADELMSAEDFFGTCD